MTFKKYMTNVSNDICIFN